MKRHENRPYTPLGSLEVVWSGGRSIRPNESFLLRYSAWSLIKNGLIGHRGWREAWRSPEPEADYDAIIVGGGGHGLATAYCLAKNHGFQRIALLEKGWIGGGNVGRNTAIIRANYMIPGNTEFYSFSLKLWEGLSQNLNFNVMFSQRGQLALTHSPTAEDAAARRANVMRCHGISAKMLTRAQLQKMIPHLDYSPRARFPIHGGLLHPSGGTARHDAVAWGYARAADRLGVDIIENCEVTGFVRKGGAIAGVETSRGEIHSEKVGLAVAGSSSLVAKLAGLDPLPIESHKLQAFVTEPLKPILNLVLSFSGLGHVHGYISQSDKGGLVFGGDLDKYPSYAQRGNLPVVQEVAASMRMLMPCLGRVRVLRHWAGLMDMSMDGSPFICKTPIEGLYLNTGWCYGGFKATPASGWCFAHTLAHDEPHSLNLPFNLERHSRGIHLDEKGVFPLPQDQ